MAISSIPKPTVINIASNVTLSEGVTNFQAYLVGNKMIVATGRATATQGSVLVSDLYTSLGYSQAGYNCFVYGEDTKIRSAVNMNNDPFYIFYMIH